MGKRKYFVQRPNHSQKNLEAVWSLELHSPTCGFFLFKFSLEDDCELILQNSWTIRGQPLILQQWHLGMCLACEMFKSFPIWIHFPKLPIQYFGEDTLSIITNMLGAPLFINKATTSRSQFSFARVYVKIDSNYSFPSVLTLMKEDVSSFNQKVEYEWKPAICATCHFFDHVASTCPCHIEWQPTASTIVEPQQQDSTAQPPTDSHMKKSNTIGAESHEVDTYVASAPPPPPHATSLSALPLVEPSLPSPTPFTELLHAEMAGNPAPI